MRRAIAAAVWVFSGWGSAHAANSMVVLKNRYEVRLGEPVEIPAAADTLDFLIHAKSRRVTMDGKDVTGLVVAPNETNDRILLAPSALAAPGEYSVTLTATSAAGEERETTMSVIVRPRSTVPTVPNGSTRPPVVLLNGWITGFSNACPIASTSQTTFGNLATYLVQDGVPVVYLFDNCVEGANQSVESLAATLATYLQTIKYDDGSQVQQIDLVAHSMGGLIARAYLSGLQVGGGYQPPAQTLVRKLILIATPNFGSFVAGNNSTLLLSGTQSAELIPGSALLWNLATWNQRSDDLHAVDAIAVIGNAGAYVPSLGATTQLNSASDGLVSLTSASLGFVSQDASKTRIVPYCHVDSGAFTNPVFGTFNCGNAGIANVTSTSHLTGQIVRSFLAGNTDWQSIGSSPTSDALLSTNGATFFAVQNTTAAYVSDITAVTWGNVSLTNGGNPLTIYYTDFVTGSGSYTVTSSSLGTINCGALAASVGYFAATRCKIGGAIVSVTPLVKNVPGRVVAAGTALTLNGRFGPTLCSNCRVYATPAGSTTAQSLSITSWADTAIVVQLPASLTGYLTITVNAVPGNDAIGVMAVSQSVLAVDTTGENFAYTIGGVAPASQTFNISNSGSGTLSWTAAVSSSASWLSVSPASGTAPSAVTVSAAPGSLTPGTYTGTITITGSGASNSPATINVTLVVSGPAASLVISPLTLSFQYTAGGAAPAPQSISITNSGTGTLSWVATSGATWAVVSPASGTAPGTVTVAAGNMAAGTYNTNVTIAASDSSVPPVTVPVTLTVQGSPPAAAISSLANAASFLPGFAPATWVAIFGSNLSQITYTWQSTDLVNGVLPPTLAGVSVTIDGVPAYVYYVSPTQINVLAPDDSATGPVQVQVTTAGQGSNSFSAQKAQFAPAFFRLDATHIAAQHLDYTLVGPPGLLGDPKATPAKPGETIILYGTGFGPTNPPVPTGQVVSASEPLANPVSIKIGGADATATFSGLTGSGLYQFNVTVPGTLSNGDVEVLANIGGISTPTGVMVTIQ